MESDNEKKKGCCCKCCTPLVTIGILLTVSVILIILGAGSIPFLSDYYINTVKKQLVMKPSAGNEAYNNWNDPPTSVYMQFYIFDYTNVHEIVTNNAKPNVTQHGPYSYREVRQNVIIDSNKYNITYLQNYSYVFDPATSCENCSENDMINTPNIAVMTILDKIKDLGYNDSSNWFIKKAMDLFSGILNEDPNFTLFIQLDVKGLLWGYTSPFLEQLEDLINKIPSFIRKYLPLPSFDPFIALQMNGTKGALAIGNLTILTGYENIDDVQKIVRWRGRSDAPFWRTKYGKMINGSDGTHAKPFNTRDDTLYIFNPQLCRSLYLKYESDTSAYDISLYRFTTTPELFENHTTNPDNWAFCGPKRCYGSGLLPVAQCQPGNPPVFMSSPHFYQGDPRLYEAINGLHPEKDLHETYLSVEPTTGIVMDAHKRLQINVNAQKVPFFDKISKPLPSENNFLPVLFVHEFATIDKKSADKFEREVLFPKKLLHYVEYGLIVLGGLILVIALILGVRYQRNKSEEGSTYKKFTDESKDAPQPIQA